MRILSSYPITLPNYPLNFSYHVNNTNEVYLAFTMKNGLANCFKIQISGKKLSTVKNFNVQLYNESKTNQKVKCAHLQFLKNVNSKPHLRFVSKAGFSISFIDEDLDSETYKDANLNKIIEIPIKIVANVNSTLFSRFILLYTFFTSQACFFKQFIVSKIL